MSLIFFSASTRALALQFCAMGSVPPGVKVTNLGFLNEPGFPASYAGMQSDGTQAAELIRVLAKTIKASGMDLFINCCDNIGWEGQEQMITALQAGPDPAEAYLKVSSQAMDLGDGMSGFIGRIYPLHSSSGAVQPERACHGRAIFSCARGCKCQRVSLLDSGRELNYRQWSHTLIGDDIIPSKRFWAFAQFSRFARPGTRRVEATSSAPLLLYVSSFLNHDGRVATQVINNGTEAYEVSFKVQTSGRIHKVQP
ncbi:hypothetical protein N7447_009564 [Penicillium robsamsonii]|uniref:uncharacterized protein n=1 Tax=Penicillium robsamsonii TaxID=1792511 RepID=UPI0025480201|nr:uncharacterized protein N7447_009564 [Penicillium robsamsonii]KAJ5817331.1 hypothetical protein N7447_009564 [Penicillium robsamsonii]